MLQGTREQPLTFDGDLLTVQPQGTDPYPLGPFDFSQESAYREAALGIERRSLARNHTRIDQGRKAFTDIKDNHTAGLAYLGGREPHAVGGVHSLSHTLRKLPHAGVDLANRPGPRAEHRVAVLPDGLRAASAALLQTGIPPVDITRFNLRNRNHPSPEAMVLLLKHLLRLQIHAEPDTSGNQPL